MKSSVKLVKEEGISKEYYVIANPHWNKVLSSIGKRSACRAFLQRKARGKVFVSPLRKGLISNAYYFTVQDA